MDWTTITQPQATIVSGGLTFAGAIIAALIAWALFARKVTNLKDAVKETESLIAAYQEQVELTLGLITERLGGLDMQLVGLDTQAASTLQSLGTISDTVSDIQAEGDEADATAPEDVVSPREQFQNEWSMVRDEMERIAADPEVDGRTRAKYGRIDRRNYLDLVDALENDEEVTGKTAKYLRDAIGLRQRYKNGRRVPAPQDVAEMARLRHMVVA